MYKNLFFNFVIAFGILLILVSVSLLLIEQTFAAQPTTCYFWCGNVDCVFVSTSQNGGYCTGGCSGFLCFCHMTVTACGCYPL
jgi:hypothetical protein